MTDGTGTSTYSFDSLNRLTSSKDGPGTIVGYSYDLEGNLTRLTYPGNHVAARTFDQDSRMASVSDWLGNTEKFSYDQNSNLISTAFPPSTSELDTQAFDNADNLISIVDSKATNQGNAKPNHGDNQGQTLASFFYTRDANNQVISESSSLSNGDGQGSEGSSNGNSGSGSKSYTYTPLNQLQNVSKTAYSYDPANNMVKLINGATQSFDVANQLLSSTTQSGGKDQHGNQNSQRSAHTQTTTFAYDLNGNRVSATSESSSTTYGFDQANQLTTFNNQATYSYNGNGLRMSKTVAGQAQQMTWDVAEGLSLLLSDSQNQYIYGPGILPIEQLSSGGQIAFLHRDQIGSTRLLTGASGLTDGAFNFDPYGNLSDGRGNTTTPFMFAGQYLDSESGLYYLRARYYDPSSGQFTSRDPSEGAATRPYSYTGGNPINGVDPSGMRRVDPWGGSAQAYVYSIGDRRIGWDFTVIAPLGTPFVFQLLVGDVPVETISNSTTTIPDFRAGGMACIPGTVITLEVVVAYGSGDVGRAVCTSSQKQTNTQGSSNTAPPGPTWSNTGNGPPGGIQWNPGIFALSSYTAGYKATGCYPGVTVV